MSTLQAGKSAGLIFKFARSAWNPTLAKSCSLHTKDITRIFWMVCLWAEYSAKHAEMEREHQAWQSDPLTDEFGAILLGRKFEDELDPQYVDELLDLREVADWDQTESKCCSVHVC